MIRSMRGARAGAASVGLLALSMALALHSMRVEVEAVRRSRLRLKKGVDRKTTMDLIGGNAGSGGLIEWFLSYVATKEDVSWIEEAESAAKRLTPAEEAFTSTIA